MKKKILLLMLLLTGFTLFNITNVFAIDNGWKNIDGYKYYYDETGEPVKGIKEINGKYYHFGETTGQLKYGDSKTLDGRNYYSNKDGVIQINWYTLNNQKYYATIENGIYRGIKEINGKYYHFGENSGQLKYGDSKTLDGRIYYSNKEGIIQTGWHKRNAGSYYYTVETGAYKGIKEINGKYYHFGENSGQLKYGDSKTLNGRIYYSNKEGIIQTGWHKRNGGSYYFTIETGAYKGIKEIGGKYYHFGENSGQLKYGDSRTLNGRIYYSNKEGVIQTNWYTANGHKYYATYEEGAYKGIKELDGKYYHFGEGSGQLKYGDSKTLDGRMYYSNKDGVIQTNWYTLNNQKYYATIENGIYRGIKELDGKYYHFGENTGQIKYKWSKTLNGKTYYSNDEGVLQKGDILIDNNWYSFKDDYSLKTGWQTINGKTYYFYADGTKAKYISKIAGVRYEFSANGELEHSNVKVIADLSFHNGYVDWNTLWKSGEIDGVILRIGYSVGMDKMFTTYLSEAKRLGIPYSVYHFSIAENTWEAQNEANHLLSWYKDNSVNSVYGVFYDIESWNDVGTSSDGITVAVYDNIINTYKTTLNNNNIHMGLYTGKNYAETRLSDYGREQIEWIAHYASYCGYKGNYRGWQYTSKGKLPGVTGDVDLSIFYY